METLLQPSSTLLRLLTLFRMVDLIVVVGWWSMGNNVSART